MERQTARVLPVNGQGHVLLLLGQDPARPGAPYWFTIGGAVEPDETLAGAAVRELWEETGIRIDPVQLVGPVHRGTHTFSYGGRDHINDSTFFAVAVDDVVVTFEGLEEGEVGNIFEARWWDPADLVAEISLSNPDLPAIAVRAATAVCDPVARLRAAGCVYAEEEAELLSAATPDPQVRATLVARRVAGEPLEPLLGWVDFAGLRLRLGPGVFVPRRRTELLARTAVELTRPGARMVDLCCGIGAVAAVVRAAQPEAEVYAAELEPTAVGWARRNLPADRVFAGDLYAAVPDRLRGRVDVIAANAPYVPTTAIALMPSEARNYEPHVALDGGPDGTAIQQRVIEGAPEWLTPYGVLLIESGREQSARTADLMREQGFVAEIRTDDELDATVVIGWRVAG